jgi:hypothetical protein
MQLVEDAGRSAPVLVAEQAVELMKPGSSQAAKTTPSQVSS